ncbi:hypothetical protein MSAN_00831100 [Mycena sanguinolenta]|uniref:Uncharacterized protein n=1 Tax=Mycena sanguinolenta TaxID=230812 RepID=A0A8H7D9W8_9AGAR|nr:hypothetical protein MSAN_00831100 [Mycena sanguinolenta]
MAIPRTPSARRNRITSRWARSCLAATPSTHCTVTADQVCTYVARVHQDLGPESQPHAPLPLYPAPKMPSVSEVDPSRTRIPHPPTRKSAIQVRACPVLPLRPISAPSSQAALLPRCSHHSHTSPRRRPQPRRRPADSFDHKCTTVLLPAVSSSSLPFGIALRRSCGLFRIPSSCSPPARVRGSSKRRRYRNLKLSRILVLALRVLDESFIIVLTHPPSWSCSSARAGILYQRAASNRNESAQHLRAMCASRSEPICLRLHSERLEYHFGTRAQACGADVALVPAHEGRPTLCVLLDYASAHKVQVVQETAASFLSPSNSFVAASLRGGLGVRNLRQPLPPSFAPSWAGWARTSSAHRAPPRATPRLKVFALTPPGPHRPNAVASALTPSNSELRLTTRALGRGKLAVELKRPPILCPGNDVDHHCVRALLAQVDYIDFLEVKQPERQSNWLRLPFAHE